MDENLNPVRDDLKEILAGLSLFSDLTPPQLEAASHHFEEVWFNEGERVLREGFTRPDFHLIIQGEAAIRVEGEEISRLTRGDFFGEISALLGDVPSADVVALTSLRCLAMTADELNKMLFEFPPVMHRLLQTEARRLRDAIKWRA